MKTLKSFIYIPDIIASASQQFPRACSCCDVEFEDFADFIAKTTIPEHNHSRNIQVIQCQEGHAEDGYILANRNCKCRSTITILCAMEDELKAKMFKTMEEDATALGMDMASVMELIRDRIVTSV